MVRGCSYCGACFLGDTDIETINKLINHQNLCSRENKFLNDENAIYYIEVL